MAPPTCDDVMMTYAKEILGLHGAFLTDCCFLTFSAMFPIREFIAFKWWLLSFIHMRQLARIHTYIISIHNQSSLKKEHHFTWPFIPNPFITFNMPNMRVLVSWLSCCPIFPSRNWCVQLGLDHTWLDLVKGDKESNQHKQLQGIVLPTYLPSSPSHKPSCLIIGCFWKRMLGRSELAHRKTSSFWFVLTLARSKSLTVCT